MFDILPVLLNGALVLGVLVFVHELGHFLVAKWLGVRVISFSIGMGPRLFGFTRGGTDYRLSLLPLGGFVRMAGDNPEEERTHEPGEFLEQPWWGRALITAAGPLANLVFAVILYVSLYLIGIQIPTSPTRLGGVREASVAERIGLKPGDAIVAWEGKPTANTLELSDAIGATLESKRGADPLRFQVKRVDSTIDFTIPRSQVETLIDGLQWDTGSVIGRVFIGLPAYDAGIKDGDEIIAIEGRRIAYWNDISKTLSRMPDRDVSILMRRGERTYTVVAHTNPEGKIGVEPPAPLTVRQSYPPLEAISLGSRHTLQTIGQIYAGLWSFITDPVRLRKSIAGPIAIAQVASQQASGGILELVAFAAFISLALMVMNLLPIPILDGGHIFFALIEGVRRKPLSLKTQYFFQRIGLVLLVGLVIFSLYNDLSRVTQRHQASTDISKRLTAPTPADTADAAATP